MALRYGPIDAKTVADLIDRFHAVYEREYTYRLDAPVEIVGLAPRRVGRGRQASPGARCRRPAPHSRPRGRAAAWSTTRSRARIRPTIYDAAMLEPGMSFTGPGGHRGRRRRPSSSIPARAPRSTRYGNIHIDARRSEDAHAADHRTRSRFEIIQNSLAGDRRRDVRGDAQDRDERDHLRGARHGHRYHRRRGRDRLLGRGDSRPSSACSTRR